MAVSDSTIPNAGLGLFSLEALKKDSLIGFYVGEYIPEEYDRDQHFMRTFYNKYGAASYIFTL